MLYLASQRAALPCHEEEDEQLLRRMKEVGVARAEDEADFAELQKRERKESSDGNPVSYGPDRRHEVDMEQR